MHETDKETEANALEEELAQLRQQLAPAWEEISLPDALRGAALLEKLTDAPVQKTPYKTMVLRFASAAASFALAAFGFGIWQRSQGSIAAPESPQPAAFSEPMAMQVKRSGEEIAKVDAASFLSAPIGSQVIAAADYDAVLTAVNELQKWQYPLYENRPMRPSTGGAGEPVPDLAPIAPNPGTSMGKQEGETFYHTNVQVEGIDEADIVKTDGRYLYVTRFDGETGESAIHILSANGLEPMSEITLGEYKNPTLYVTKNRLLVVQDAMQTLPAAPAVPTTPAMIVPDYMTPAEQSVAMTEIITYDITSRRQPQELSRYAQVGELVSSRLKDDTLYLVTNRSVWGDFSDNPSPYDYLPFVARNGVAELLSATEILLPPERSRPAYALVGSLSVETGESKTQAVLGMADAMMMSHDAFFLAANIPAKGEHYGREDTGITRFDLTPEGLSYRSSGRVSGVIDSVFSLDEYEGNLRIATTERDENWETSSRVTILDPAMQEIGSVAELAKNERIYSARFVGTVAYVVTYRETDPLFVIDLSDPEKPIVKGELKIPGFSEYLHPWDENTLIGIGKNTVQTARGGSIEDGIKLSLFDVSNPADPKETATLLLGNRGSESEVLEDHRALMVYPEKNLIGFPATLYTVAGASSQNPWSGEQDLAFSGFLAVEVAPTGFTLTGTIPSGEEEPQVGYFRQDAADTIYRGMYLGETLYTVSDNSVRAFSLADMQPLGSVSLA